MPSSTYIELFGYLGSILVVVSMLMSSVIKLRIFNTIGSIISCTYALIIGSLPLGLMNFCLIIINIYNLYKLRKTEKNYDIVKSVSNDALIKYILDKHRKDIINYFPGFNFENNDDNTSFVILCGGRFAGLLIAEEKENNILNILLDYTSPEYRDCSVARYLYQKLPSFNIDKLSFSQPMTNKHEQYLQKMGYKKTEDVYLKNL